MTDLLEDIRQVCPTELPMLLEKLYTTDALLSCNLDKSAEYRIGYAKGVIELITMLKDDDF